MADYIVRATAAGAAIRAFAITSRDLVETARQDHNTSPIMTAALGRLLSGGAMMGTMLKGEKDLLTLQIQCSGPARGLTVTADANGHVKGFVNNPIVELPPNKDGHLNVGGALDLGILSVIKDMGLKEPYVGQCQLQTGEIAEDLTYYFATSEQIPSAVGLGVLIDTDGSVKQAGGFIIQLLPFAKEEIISELEARLKDFQFTKLLEEGKSVEEIIALLFDGYDTDITDRMPCAYVCDCSKERVEQAVISLGRQEIASMIEDNEPIEVVCDFCHTKYTFSPDELLNILQEGKVSNTRGY